MLVVCGIYALYFEQSDMIYVGKSTNIHRRYRDHVYLLSKHEHYNYKVQREYNKYGAPSLEIIVECDSTYLDEKEIEVIQLLDNVSAGLNITPGGSSTGSGTTGTNSKYTTEEIEAVFFRLTDITLTNKDIAEQLGLPIDLVINVAYKKNHLWVHEKYPEKSRVIEAIVSSNIRQKLSKDKVANNKTIRVISPDGQYHEFYNIARFAREHGLNQSHLNQLVLGKTKQHKKWILANDQTYGQG